MDTCPALCDPCVAKKHPEHAASMHDAVEFEELRIFLHAAQLDVRHSNACPIFTTVPAYCPGLLFAAPQSKPCYN
jgi:hypothetical protein